MIPNIQTTNTLVFVGNTGHPVTVSTSHKNYEEILRIVNTSEPSTDVYEALQTLVYPVNKLRKIVNYDNSSFFLDSYNVLTCEVNGTSFTLPANLAAAIISLYEKKGDLTPFVRFVEKLSRNPDPSVTNQLWDFITACGLCLDTNGNFLAYKNVREDFKSIHDGITDNTPGTVVKMKRKKVEKDPHTTCASGLHFAAWGYLAHFYAHGAKTVLVSVSPKDVVSIPSDYNNQKGRACRYKIVRETARPEELKDTVLYEEPDSDYDDDIDYED